MAIFDFIHTPILRKILAPFLLSCSLIIVLGHSILPHDHLEDEGDTFNITQKKNLSLAELIKLSFSHDLGTNHLEEYKDSKSLQLIPTDFDGLISETQTSGFLVVSFIPRNENTTATSSEVTNQYFFTDAGRRAPPIGY